MVQPGHMSEPPLPQARMALLRDSKRHWVFRQYEHPPALGSPGAVWGRGSTGSSCSSCSEFLGNTLIPAPTSSIRFSHAHTPRISQYTFEILNCINSSDVFLGLAPERDKSLWRRHLDPLFHVVILRHAVPVFSEARAPLSLVSSLLSSARADVCNGPGHCSGRRGPGLRAEVRAGLKQPGPAPAGNLVDWAA
ncbi:hypothetical protein EV426DRAFT_578369 [Tirmania nivea]|nr:hypothetical protein EV426DRAFT_578369 [Tirmania nivea]